MVRAAPNMRAIASALPRDKTLEDFEELPSPSSPSSSSSFPTPADFPYNPRHFNACPGFLPQPVDFLFIQSLTLYDDDADRSRPPKRNFLIFGVTPGGQAGRLRACRDLALNAKSIARAVVDGASVVVTMDANMDFFNADGLVRVVVFFCLLFFLFRVG